MDITYDELDAILRDPQVPADVRAAVQTELACRTYLSRVEFHESDTGVTSVTYRDTPIPVAEAAPSNAQAQASNADAPASTVTTDGAPTDVPPPATTDVPPPAPGTVPVQVSEEVAALTPEQRAALRAELDSADAGTVS